MLALFHYLDSGGVPVLPAYEIFACMGHRSISVSRTSDGFPTIFQLSNATNVIDHDFFSEIESQTSYEQSRLLTFVIVHATSISAYESIAHIAQIQWKSRLRYIRAQKSLKMSQADMRKSI